MSEDNIVTPEDKEIEKLAEGSDEEKGKKVLQNLIDQIEAMIKDAGLDIKDFDTEVIIDGDFDTIKIKDNKVVFGDGHDLNWALTKVSPFQLYESLGLVKDIISGYIELQKMPSPESSEMADFGRIWG